MYLKNDFQEKLTLLITIFLDMFMTHVSKYRMSTKEIIKYKHKFIFRRIFYKCLKTSLHVENEILKWGKIFFIIHLETNFMLKE